MTRQRKIGYYPFNLEYQQSLRAKVITFLGGKCSNPQCLVPGGCTDKRCLQVDHINGISNDEPRLIGIMLYEDILNNPKSKEKYQLLCANCNWIKRSEKNENRGYSERAYQKKPRYPIPLMPLGGHCSNPGMSCAVCNNLECTIRYTPKHGDEKS